MPLDSCSCGLRRCAAPLSWPRAPRASLGAMGQLLLWVGLLEVVSFISIDQMLRGSGREPGDFGFDPIGFSSDPKVKPDLQMKELAIAAAWRCSPP